MSSATPPFGLPSNPRDTPRTRRYGSATDPTDVVPVDIRQKVSQRRASNRTPNQQPPQGKTVANTPQTGRARRPALPVAAKTPSSQVSRAPTMNPPEGSISTVRSAQGAPPKATTATTPSSNKGQGQGQGQDSIPVPTRSILRKKQPIQTQSRGGTVFHSRGDSERTASSSSSSVDPSIGTQSDRIASQSPDGIQVAHTVELPRTQAHAITIYPELDRYRNIPAHSYGSNDLYFEVPFHLATHDLPVPPTPAYSGTSSQLSTASPSTRFSESPGAYSRDTTPTSVSSQSPGMLASMRFAPHQKPRQTSPAYSRPPVTRRRTGSMSNDIEVSGGDYQGLAAVREALTSSSSNSTVRDGDRSEQVKPKTKEKKQLPPTPPSPPPRKSSQKFTEAKTESSPRRPPHGNTTTITSPAKATASRARPALQSRATPPSRPSRDNTPDLHSQIPDPPPIVHSNLTHAPVVLERPSTAGRQQSFSPLPRRMTPSPALCKPAARAAPLPPGREATPKPRPSLASPLTSPEKATKTTNASSFNTRFPFFSKRSKTAPDLSQVDDKPTRKGPVAGTGHEGYGRIGSIRRRSGSMLIGRSNPEPDLPRPTVNANRSVDTFLQDRTSPVVISGGEVVHNRNISSDLSRVDSHQSFAMSRPSVDSRWDSETSTTSSVHRDSNRISSLPRVTRPRVSHRRPSDSSDSEAVAMKSTLAFRRSVQRLRASPEQEPLRIPKPIITSRGASPSINSRDAGFRTDDSMPDSEWEGLRGRKATTTPPRKLTKKARSPRKWNPFSRSQSRPKKSEEPEPVSATVTVVQQPQIPFYAVMDGSEQEDMEPQRIEDVLRDAHVFDGPLDIPTPPRLSVRTKLPSELPEPKKSLEKSPEQSSEFRLPPQPRQLRRIDKVIGDMTLDTSMDSAETETRPSRLAQVGRIPKVVNTRVDESPRSFSRPFNRLSYQRMTPVDTPQDQFIAKGPSPPKPSTPELTPETSSGETLSGSNSHATPPDLTSREFLTMSPNKNYQGHTSSSSSGSTNFAFAYELAVLPDPNGPLVEDEIWEEYNDLLGEVPPSATSSKGIPFHLEAFSKNASKQSQVAESPTIAQAASKADIPIQPVDECFTDCESECSNESGDMTERIRKAFAPKPELGRSVLRSPRAPTSAPRTPKLDDAVSFRSPARTPKLSGELKQKSPVRTPKPTIEPKSRSPAVSQKRASDSSSKSHKSDSSCKSSEDESPLAQVNLRVGSMTVSKWLSFGHVLFSPGREELVPEEGSLKRHSILVIDGLGNDDWSFYAAETYPMATFFNMSPRAPLPKLRKTVSNFPLSPPNHHQIQFVSHLGKFPFGPESFTSVVYRFPAAAPESHYRNIISEARRVLKPGGYIELSLLDVDLNNMGNRGRRAVRQLKERLREKTPDISLGSSSDLAVRLLGSNGFSDIKSCHVGVPVASVVTKSDAASTQRTTPRGFKQAKEQRSLADLMNDKSDSADENITKMVAKVGRWWYTRCYEGATREDAAVKSIWTDRALLAECDELRTSLKLMVCYARVPERSRIASI